MKERAFVIATFGDRQKQVSRLVNNIQRYSDYPIHIISDDIALNFPKNIRSSDRIFMERVSRIWPENSYRSGIRNSNYFKVRFANQNHYHSLCMLDDDMLIVHEDFVQGFEIAERLGIALPLNPRVYVGYNAMGADVSVKDLEEVNQMPLRAPACNFSPFFVYPHCGYTANFLFCLEDELSKENVCRGTLAIWKASWKSGISPVYLPEQWCICGDYAEHFKNYSIMLKGRQVKVEPIMLHLGHEKVRQVYGLE